MSETPLYYVTFLRHGESVGNAEDRFQGHADFPLTGKGRAQARALAERWLAEGVTFDACIASPLFFFTAAEHSGDALGAAVIPALRRIYPEARFAGVGGRKRIHHPGCQQDN